MDRKAFDKMELLEQVKYFNKQLAEGKTIRDIAEGIGIARSTVTDRFKKIGYKYNKELNIYTNSIYTKNTDITKISNNNNNTKMNKMNIDDDIKELLKYKDVLLELAADYKNRTATDTEININDIPAELKAGVVIKSIKVYTDIAGKFETICNRYKGIKKQDLYSLALMEFTEKYSKK